MDERDRETERERVLGTILLETLQQSWMVVVLGSRSEFTRNCRYSLTVQGVASCRRGNWHVY